MNDIECEGRKAYVENILTEFNSSERDEKRRCLDTIISNENISYSEEEMLNVKEKLSMNGRLTKKEKSYFNT